MTVDTPKNPPEKPNRDEDWMEILKRTGSDSAMNELVLRYKDRIFSFLVKMLENSRSIRKSQASFVAGELTNEVFERVFKYRHTWNRTGTFNETGAFNGWILKIARNSALTFLMQEEKRLRALLASRSVDSSVDNHSTRTTKMSMEIDEDREKAEAWLNEKYAQVDKDCKALPREVQKKMVYLRIKRRLRLDDIAREMGFSLSYVEKQLREVKRIWKKTKCISYKYLVDIRKFTRPKNRTVKRRTQITRRP